MNCKADVIIVGGGASGLFAAVWLAKGGKDVLLFEQNRMLGKKLLITGKGRCNVTNNSDVSNVMKNIPTNPRFLFSALSGFTPADTMAFFESEGVKLKTERGNRVFPLSDKSQDIVSALEKAAKRYGVRFEFSKVSKLLTDGGKVLGVEAGKTEFFADKVLIATGGASYPKTGSTGDGYRFAASVGHTVTELAPSLVPICTVEKYPVDLMGLSLKNVTLSLFEKDKSKPVYSELGEMLFTHFGVSGPLVLSASCHMKKDKLKERQYRMEIDLKPGLDENKLDDRIVRDFSEFPNKDFQNSLVKLLPQALAPVVVDYSKIPPMLKVNQVTKQQRRELVKVLKHLPLTPLEFRPIEEAIITSGGVSVKEINPKTMESKLVSGLYFIGEVLDVDAYTGGYNLQIAFSTAYAAAMGIISE